MSACLNVHHCKAICGHHVMINGHGKDGDVDSDGDAVYSFIFVISVIVSLFLNM